MPTSQSLQPVLDQVQTTLAAADVFSSVKREGDGLRCNAMHVDVTCYYALTIDSNNQVWIGWYSPDRWLSESIEAELVHTGDKIEELIGEEYADQGLDLQPRVEHFRNDDKVFVFRTPLALPDDASQAAEIVAKALLSYQACFLELGDMSGDEE